MPIPNLRFKSPEFARRLAFLLVLIGALFPTAAYAQDTPKPVIGRDWKRHPAVLEMETTQDIYVIGDIHADYERLITLLLACKIIADDPTRPELIQWNAGKAVMVCTGDFINKWDQSYQVIAALRALQTSAAKAGGQLIVTMGNHEAEFLANVGKGKKSAEFVKDLKARGINPEDVIAGRDKQGMGEYLRSLPFAARVNDWFFAHAGNTQGRSLKKLQTDLEEGVEAKGFKAEILLDPNSLLLARLHPSPWWEKEGEKPEAGQERLAGYARALGVKHFVLGHQPGKVVFADQTTRAVGEPFQKFDGLLFLIDVGMSRGAGGSTGALLHINADKHDRVTALFPDHTTRELWPKP